MKKNILIGIGILVIIILGVVYWPKQGRAPEGPVTAMPQPAPASAPTGAPVTSTSTASSSAGTGMTMTSTLGWKKYKSTAYGITLSYPADWQIGFEQPIILDNFNNKYSNDGNVPTGGAEIDLAGTEASGSVDDIINTELMHAQINSTTTVSAAGGSCKEFFYTGMYKPGSPSKNIAVYCPGKMLLKIFLSYNQGDSKGASFEATFKQFLGTISRF